MKQPRSSFLLPLGVVALAIAAFVAHAMLYRHWTEDDAYISMRYARNATRGAGLVFNPGERVEGYSNFSWVLVSVAAIRLGLEPLPVAKVVGLEAAAIAIILSWRLAKRLAPARSQAPLLAPVLLAISPVLAHHSTSGLESGLFASLMLAAVLAGMQEPGPRQRAMVVGLALLLALTRPEGPAIALVILTLRAVVAPSLWASVEGARRRAILDLVFFVTAYLPYVAWRVSYYGSLLPNTYYAKGTGGLRAASNGLEHMIAFMRDSGGVLFVGLALAPFAVGLAGPAWFLAAGTAAAYISFVILSGGDYMFHYRFVSHVLPLLAALIAAGLGAMLSQWQGVSGLRAVALRGTVGLLLVMTFLSMVTTERTVARFILPAIDGDHFPPLSYRRLAVWLRVHTPPGATIASSDIGAIGFYTDRHILDMYGLVDAHLARLPGRAFSKADPAYVLSRKPEYVVLVSHNDSGAGRVFQRAPDAALAAQAEFHERYELIHMMPTRWDDEYDLVYRRRPARIQ